MNNHSFIPLTLLLVLLGCSSSDMHDRMIGQWELTKIESDSKAIYTDPVDHRTVFHFEENICKISTDSTIHGEGTWSLDGSALEMNFDHIESGMRSRIITVQEVKDDKMILIFVDTIANSTMYYHFISTEGQ